MPETETAPAAVDAPTDDVELEETTPTTVEGGTDDDSPFGDLLGAVEFKAKNVQQHPVHEGPVDPAVTALVGRLVADGKRAEIPVKSLEQADMLHSHILAAGKAIGKSATVRRLYRDETDKDKVTVLSVTIGERRGRKDATAANG